MIIYNLYKKKKKVSFVFFLKEEKSEGNKRGKNVSPDIYRHTTVEYEYQWETRNLLISIYRIFTYYPELGWNHWKNILLLF